MSTPFIGEIRPFSFAFAPKGWLPCNGQILPVQQNQALFSILGTTYGGDGIRTFQLPNLQGAVAIHPGGFVNAPGVTGGEAGHVLKLNEVPSHTHTVSCQSTSGNLASPSGNFFAASMAAGTGFFDTQFDPKADSALNSGALVSSPGLPHSNMQPSQVLLFCIATAGIYPSRN